MIKFESRTVLQHFSSIASWKKYGKWPKYNGKLKSGNKYYYLEKSSEASNGCHWKYEIAVSKGFARSCIVGSMWYQLPETFSKLRTQHVRKFLKPTTTTTLIIIMTSSVRANHHSIHYDLYRAPCLCANADFSRRRVSFLRGHMADEAQHNRL